MTSLVVRFPAELEAHGHDDDGGVGRLDDHAAQELANVQVGPLEALFHDPPRQERKETPSEEDGHDDQQLGPGSEVEFNVAGTVLVARS